MNTDNKINAFRYAVYLVQNKYGNENTPSETLIFLPYMICAASKNRELAYGIFDNFYFDYDSQFFIEEDIKRYLLLEPDFDSEQGCDLSQDILNFIEDSFGQLTKRLALPISIPLLNEVIPRSTAWSFLMCIRETPIDKIPSYFLLEEINYFSPIRDLQADLPTMVRAGIHPQSYANSLSL